MNFLLGSAMFAFSFIYFGSSSSRVLYQQHTTTAFVDFIRNDFDSDQ